MNEKHLVSVNVLGIVEQSNVGNDPYRIDHDGNPYVPIGDGGIVLGLSLGDGVFQFNTDHAAPGLCVTHPNPDAANALSAQACIGNLAEIRTGQSAGQLGIVLGKRGEGGRVIVHFQQSILRNVRPGDQIAIRSIGQGLDPSLPGVTTLNISPLALNKLPIKIEASKIGIGVRAIVDSEVVGNGIGRPMPMWDVDLQIGPSSPAAEKLVLGDLVAVRDLDARYNAGYRKGWMSVGLVIHGGSPQPGHGPGLTIFLTGPADSILPRVEFESHVGLTEQTMVELINEWSNS